MPESPVQPLYDRIIVERDPSEAKVGSIFLPESSKEKPRTGVILAIGPGPRSPTTLQHIGLTVKPGQRVLFSKYAGTEIGMKATTPPVAEGETAAPVPDRDLLIMCESDVLGVVNEAAV